MERRKSPDKALHWSQEKIFFSPKIPHALSRLQFTFLSQSFAQLDI